MEPSGTVFSGAGIVKLDRDEYAATRRQKAIYAFWLVTPDGARTRARLYEVDGDGDIATYRLGAVEKPVPQLPSVRVEPLPEVIREHRVPTPVGLRQLLEFLSGAELVAELPIGRAIVEHLVGSRAHQLHGHVLDGMQRLGQRLRGVLLSK